LEKTASKGGDLITRQIQFHFMKTFIGVLILVMLLVAASGCTTQQAKPTATEAIVTTPVSATEVPTGVNTPLPITMPAKVTTTGAAADVTAQVTPAATPRPSNTWSVRYLTIHIRNNTYVPDELTILPGAGVTWVNDDSVIHIVKATGDSAGKFTSSEIINGAQFHYTFGEKTGTFEFGDPKYPEMKGAVIVRTGESVVGTSSLISQGSS
jgi:plastocyanin